MPVYICAPSGTLGAFWLETCKLAGYFYGNQEVESSTKPGVVIFEELGKENVSFGPGATREGTRGENLRVPILTRR